MASNELGQVAHGARIAVAGMAVARQRPATANGVVFMLLEDECGQVNLIIPPQVYETHRAIIRAEPLLLATGRFERVGRNENLIVSEAAALGCARPAGGGRGGGLRGAARRTPLRAPLSRRARRARTRGRRRPQGERARPPRAHRATPGRPGR